MSAGCLGKIGYPTRADAAEARSRLIARGQEGLKIYHCRKCGRHHLGRWRRDGKNMGKTHRKTADHEAGSFKARLARWKELTGMVK
jgi:hypothetical protein